MWREPDGNNQSKLLLMESETVVLELTRGGTKPMPRRPATAKATK